MEPSRTVWGQAIAIFEFYALYDASARNGLNALWDYRRRFEAAKTQGQQQQPFQNMQNQMRPSDPVSQSAVTPDNNNNTATATTTFQKPNATLSSGDVLLPDINNRLFASEDQGLNGDFSQTFSDLDWIDFDISEFLS